MIDIKAKMFQLFNYLKGLALLRYVLDLVSQGLSGVSITPAVGQRTQVVSGHDASSYDESFPRFRVKIKDLKCHNMVSWVATFSRNRVDLSWGVWIATQRLKVFLQRISFSNEACHFEFRGNDMANYQIPMAEQMNCSGDLPTNWKMFREAYEDYLEATGLDKKNKKIQVATLKTLMGTSVRRSWNACNSLRREWKIHRQSWTLFKTILYLLGIYCTSDTFSTTRSSKHMKLLINYCSSFAD